MTRDGIYAFLRRFHYGVISTTSAEGAPQSALVGYAATPELHLVFDTLRSSRKFANIIRNPRCSFVVGGWDSEQTLQFEGEAHELTISELAHYKNAYLASFPEAIERMKHVDIVYVAVEARWMRYSDYDQNPVEIQEWKF